MGDGMGGSGVTGCYTYFFTPNEKVAEVVAFDLPSYSTQTIFITLSVPAGDVSVGEIVLGAQKTIGGAVFGSGIGIVDYSRKERDDFGNAVIVERGYSQTSSYDVSIETKNVRHIQRQLGRLRAKPLVWSGTDDGGYGLLIYGYFTDFDIQLSGPLFSDCSIEVEGLT